MSYRVSKGQGVGEEATEEGRARLRKILPGPRMFPGWDGTRLESIRQDVVCILEDDTG